MIFQRCSRKHQNQRSVSHKLYVGISVNLAMNPKVYKVRCVFLWSFLPIFAWGSIQKTTIRKTRPTLEILPGATQNGLGTWIQASTINSVSSWTDYVISGHITCIVSDKKPYFEAIPPNSACDTQINYHVMCFRSYVHSLWIIESGKQYSHKTVFGHLTFPTVSFQLSLSNWLNPGKWLFIAGRMWSISTWTGHRWMQSDLFPS